MGRGNEQRWKDGTVFPDERLECYLPGLCNGRSEESAAKLVDALMVLVREIRHLRWERDDLKARLERLTEKKLVGQR